MFILGEDEGLILKANEAFIDVDEKEVMLKIMSDVDFQSPS